MSRNAGDMDLGVEVSKGILAKFTQAFLGFIGIIIFARELDKVGFGSFYLLLSLVQVVDRPVVGGWAAASKKRYSEYGSKKEEVAGAQILFNLGAVLVVGLVLFSVSDWLTAYTGLPKAPFYFMILFVPTIFFYPFLKMISAKGEVGKETWTDTIRSLLTTPLQVALVILGLGAAGMVWGLGLATVLTLPITYYFLGVRPQIPSVETIRNMWIFAKHSIPVSAIGNAYDRYDVLLLGIVVGQSSVANYEVALKLTLPAMFVANVGGSALMSKVSNLESRGKDISRDITNTLAFTSIFGIPIFFGAAAIPESLLVTAYGTKYADAVFFLVGLAFYRLLRTQTQPLQQMVNGVDRPDLNVKLSGGTLSLNVVLGLALIVAVGPIGVVVATIIAEAFRYCGFVYVTKQELPGVVLIPPPLQKELMAGVVMFAVIYIVSSAVPLPRAWHVGGVVALGGCVYFGVLILISSQFNALTRDLFDKGCTFVES